MVRDGFEGDRRWGGRTLDSQVAANERFGHVDCFDVDFDAVFVAFGLLGAAEFAAGAEHG